MTKRQHQWGPSRVGHGEAQCIWCHCTNREAMFALGMVCDAAPDAEPKGSIVKINDSYIHRDVDTEKLSVVSQEDATIFEDEELALKIYARVCYATAASEVSVELIDV